jgi:hypothetical protein
MACPFDFAHLDPSRDPPELYRDAFDLLCELWDRLRTFRASCREDAFLSPLILHLEDRLVAAGLVLSVKIEVDARRSLG